MTVKIGLSHLKPLKNSHFYFLISVESPTLVCGSFPKNQLLHSWRMHAFLCWTGKNGALISMDVCLTVFDLSSQFCDMLYCTPSPKTSCQLAVMFDGENITNMANFGLDVRSNFW